MRLPKFSGKQKRPKLIIRRIVGSSMTPNLAPRQIIVATGWFHAVRAGQVFVFYHEGKEKIKRVERVEDGKVFFIGDNLEESSDSRHFGWVRIEDLTAHVVWPRVSRELL
jgi:phage repressor protein C with HTH and peptisase S24 domain